MGRFHQMAFLCPWVEANRIPENWVVAAFSDLNCALATIRRKMASPSCSYYLPAVL
jgi:hypothetical protein